MEKTNVIPPEDGRKQASSEAPPKFDRLKNAEASSDFDFTKDKKLKK